jgi:hypothetical protein
MIQSFASKVSTDALWSLHCLYVTKSNQIKKLYLVTTEEKSSAVVEGH